jgi:hypothetical protein
VRAYQLLDVVDELLGLGALVLRELEQLRVPAADALLELGVLRQEVVRERAADGAAERGELGAAGREDLHHAPRDVEVERALRLGVRVHLLHVVVRALRDRLGVLAVLGGDLVELVERLVDVRARARDHHHLSQASVSIYATSRRQGHT